uniref:Pentraxin-related protein PTX3 n=1 Tax=Geotrypetes seraphini TaxID=260995 RepID=A0A6P8SER7_GEOSA|nr:pentraxin-related protein PTX3 [Geotrypetes seraphini]
MNMLIMLCCILWSFSSGLSSDYDILYTSYDNDLENEIHSSKEESAPTSDCLEERTTWDKIFIMLENSQMKQNMMLQSIDEILTVELQSLRTEMMKCVTTFAGTCSSAVTGATSQMMSQVNRMLTNISQIQCPEAAQQPGQASILKEIFLLNHNISKRLSKLENIGERATEAAAQETAFRPQDKSASVMPGSTLSSLLNELQQTRAELQTFQKQAAQRSLPAGCEMALLFPMRSARIFASIHPSAEMTLRFFTICAWVKVTEALKKTIVFSYGTKQSPTEIQLHFSQQSAVLVVGSSENKLVAENVISPGQWTPLCSTWSSEDGTASIWVNGESRATSTEMAKSHVISGKGILQIGQEKNGCCVGGGFDESIAFSGKITGFNVWDTVLTKEEIKTQTSGSNSCNNRGNIVGWGITEIQPHGGATYIY